MTDDLVATLHRIAQQSLRLSGPIPEGDLAEHFDSVERLTLVVAIEDHFEITFDEAEEDEVRTFDDVVALIRRKLEARDG